MLKQKYFLTDFFILSAEKQPIKSSWRKIEWLPDSPNENGKIAFNQIVPEENSPILNFLLMWILPGLIFYIIWLQTSKTIIAVR